MEAYAFPMIGDQRVDEIGSNGALDVLQPIWLTKPETARRVRQRMRAVFDWCLAKHFRETMNPVDAVRKALPRQTDRPKHHTALPYIELPAFLVPLETSPSNIIVKTALAFLIHTASRTGEVLGASWPETDGERRIWTVPMNWRFIFGALSSGFSDRREPEKIKAVVDKDTSLTNEGSLTCIGSPQRIPRCIV